MSTNLSSMFESIKDALTKEKSTSGLKDILRLEAGATYQVRLIPNIKDPANTFFHYYNHGWKSVATGQFVSAISPTTWNEPDPIAQTRFKIAKEGNEEEKTKSALLNRKENWLANVFVVNDPKHPENNNKIKILRLGRQIHKIIMEAIEGDEAAEFGERIFDLTSSGVNLKIKAEQQGDFTTYVASKFGSPSEIAGLTPEKIQEVYISTFDLTKIFTVKSYDELQTMVDEHYYGNVKGAKPKVDDTRKSAKVVAAPVVEDDVPMGDSTPASATSAPEVEAPKATGEVLDDAKVKELLKGLD